MKRLSYLTLFLGISLFFFVQTPPCAHAAAPGSSSESSSSAAPLAATGATSFQTDAFTGRMSTSISIALPPGRLGMQPQVQLNYSSSTENGIAGVGWSLNLGHIQRSLKHGVPSYTGTDIFEAEVEGSSSELVQIADGTFRDRDEGGFRRFRLIGGQQGYWEMTTKNGTRYLFGQTLSSQAIFGEIFRWALDKIIDTNGNTITILYSNPEGEPRPVEIRYTGHEPSGLAAANSVKFKYEMRDDHEVSYRTGFPISMSFRLSEIKTYAQDQLVSTYTFSYNTSFRTDRSLLVAVKRIGVGDDTSLPSTYFLYNVQSYNASPFPVMVSNDPPMAADVHGTGKSNVIRFTPATGTWTVSCVQSCPNSGVWLTNFGTPPSNSYTVPLLGDWNDDSKTDIAVYDVLSGEWKFANSTGTSFVQSLIAPFTFTYTNQLTTPLTGDFNGDHIADIGIFSNGQWSFRLGNGQGFPQNVNGNAFTLSSWGASQGSVTYDPLSGDFNGDGITDIAILDKVAGTIYIRYSTSAGWSAPIFGVTGFGPGANHTVADVDGDGHSDLLYYVAATGRIYCVFARYLHADNVYFGETVLLPGTFDLHHKDSDLQVGDFDGDGSTDFMVFDPNGKQSQHSLSGTNNFGDLLRYTRNSFGGATTVTYQASTLLPFTKLPFFMPVVASVTADDGMGNSYTTSYQYQGGLYDIPSKEFRGFAQVTELDPEGNSTVSLFHQDSDKKGRPLLTSFAAQDGTLRRFNWHTWSTSTPYPDARFTQLDKIEMTSYDSGVSQGVSTRTRFTYDSYGNTIRTDEDGDLSKLDDGRTTEVAYNYNTSAWILDKPAFIQKLDSSGNVIGQHRFFYDGASNNTTQLTLGNVTRKEDWLDLPTPQWLGTSMTYDVYGNLTSTIDGLNHVTTNQYDTASGTYLVKVINPLNQAQNFVYDPKFGELISSTDQNGVTQKVLLDGFGRTSQTSFIEPGTGQEVVTSKLYYNLSGNAPFQTAGVIYPEKSILNTLMTRKFYDGLGRLIQTRSPAEDASKEIVSGAIEFDALGRVRKQWAPFFNTKSDQYVAVNTVVGLTPPLLYTYDAFGRVLTTTKPDNSVSTMSYNDLTNTAVDANGHMKRHTTDVYGRILKVEEFNQGAIYTTNYTHDAGGNLTKVTDHHGNSVTVQYDSFGRKLSMQDPDMGNWTYTYDLIGNLSSQTDARGVKVQFFRDAVNRLTQKSYSVPPRSNIRLPATVSYAYDDPTVPYSVGRLTQITDGAGTTKFSYDHLGRKVQETQTLDGVTYVSNNIYDLLGRPTMLSYPDGGLTLYGYNKQGAIEAVGYANGQGDFTFAVVNIDYNASNQITKVLYGNSVTSEYFYNPLTTRLTHFTSTSSTPELLQDLSYTYDPLGNITAITDALDPSASQTFGFDDLNRMISASGAYGAHNYSYDPIGNMTSKEGVTLTYGQNGLRPHAVTASGDGWSMQYDSNGNLIKRANSNVANTYEYDADNHLVRVAKEGIAVSGSSGPIVKKISAFDKTEYVYNGDGARIKEIITNGAKKQVTRYLGASYEIAADETTTKHIFAGNQRIASLDSVGNWAFYLPDHLGSTDVVTNLSGEVIERTSYSPYGSIFSDSGSVKVPFKFTGQKQDLDNELVLFPARTYEPKFGRFMQPDSIVQALSDPQTFNRYSYVRNNPVNLVDPTGHKFKWKKWFGVVMGVIATIATGGLGAPAFVTAITAAFVSTTSGALVNGVPLGKAYQLGVVSGFTAMVGGQLIPTSGFYGGAAVGAASNAAGAALTATIMGGDPLKAALKGAAGSVVGSGLQAWLGSNGVSTGSKSLSNLPGNLLVAGGRGAVNAAIGGENPLQGALGAVQETVGSTSLYLFASDPLDVIGKVWALPNTVVGVTIGMVGTLFGGDAPTLGNNGIQFTNSPFASSRSAYTIGNSMVYGSGLDPSSEGPSPYTGWEINAGQHEGTHTYQYQKFGPFFFLAYLSANGCKNQVNPFEVAADMGSLTPTGFLQFAK
jgi:RHS repeat-associated protein